MLCQWLQLYQPSSGSVVTSKWQSCSEKNNDKRCLSALSPLGQHILAHSHTSNKTHNQAQSQLDEERNSQGASVSASNAPVDAARDLIFLRYCSGTLLTQVQLVHQDLQVHVSKACS